MVVVVVEVRVAVKVTVWVVPGIKGGFSIFLGCRESE